jgi:two-component system response regulator CpxR
MRILYVEDELEKQNPIVRLLSSQNHEVELIDNVNSALLYIKTSEPDILLCDYLLGKGPNGLLVAENTRNLYPATTIIMISSHLSVDNAVKAMQIGVDDFIQRPISPNDLLERIWSAFTRHQSRYVPPKPSPAASSRLYLDMHRRLATWDNQPLDLTTIEFSLLSYLASRPGQLVTFSDLWASSHGDRLDKTDARVILKPHISKLRAKLKNCGASDNAIQNVRGQGYIWSPG